MNPVRVFIATTAGLVAVQRITEEDPEVNSVVCLAGKAVALPISAAYEAFVRDPTGIIQRHFGHPAYRVDVSAAVDEGYSWQLALFAAHALVKADRLAHPDADAPLTVIATGEVNRDLHVLDVDHLADKFGDLAVALQGIGADPARTVLAVPRGNGDDVAAHVTAAGLSDDLNVMPVAHAREVLDRLDIDLGAGPSAAPAVPETPAAARRAGGGRKAMLALLALVLAGSAGAAGVHYSPQLQDWAGQWIPAPKPAEKSTPEATEEPAPKPTMKETVALPAPDPKPSPVPAASPTPAPKPAEAAPTPEAPAPAPVAAVSPPVELPPPDPTPQAAAPTPPPLPKPAPVPAKITVPPTRPAEIDRMDTAAMRDAPKNAVFLEILENRAPPGYACRDVRAGRIKPDVHAAPQKGPFAFGPSVMDNLCSVEIKATAREDGLYLFGRYHRWTRTRPGEGAPDKIIDLGPRQGNVHWSVDIPENLRRGASFQVLVFSSWNSFNMPTKLLARIGTKPRSPEARKAVKRLKNRGIALKTTRFRVVPERRPPVRQPSGSQTWRANPGG